MADIKKTFGSRVRYFRQEMNLSQTELARKLKIAQAYLSRIEGGHIGPSTESLELFSKFFNVNADDLLRPELAEMDREFLSMETQLEQRKKELQSLYAKRGLLEAQLLNPENNNLRDLLESRAKLEEAIEFLLEFVVVTEDSLREAKQQTKDVVDTNTVTSGPAADILKTIEHLRHDHVELLSQVTEALAYDYMSDSGEFFALLQTITLKIKRHSRLRRVISALTTLDDIKLGSVLNVLEGLEFMNLKDKKKDAAGES